MTSRRWRIGVPAVAVAAAVIATALVGFVAVLALRPPLLPPDHGFRSGPPGKAPPPCALEAIDSARMLEDVIDQKATACELEALDALIASRYAQHGPWNQDIRVAGSPDGLNFAPLPPPLNATTGATPVDAPVVATAAVPEIVRGDDGRYYLFYVDGDLERLRNLAREHSPWFRTHGLPGIGALELAVSDDGLHFEPVSEFGIEGLVRGMVVDPDVIRLPDGRWRMYYVGLPAPEFVHARWIEGEQHTVFSAVSGDLVHWKQEGEVVRGPYADPSVLCDGARCLMASFGLEWSTSSDGGRSFKFLGPGAIRGFAPELMRLDDGSMQMLYNEKRAGAPLVGQVSADGRSWKPMNGTRLSTYGEAPTVTRARDGRWLLYYHTFKSPDDIPSITDGASPRERRERGARQSKPPAGSRP